MELRKIAQEPPCIGSSCPTVYESDRGTIVVQGKRVGDASGLDVPSDEVLAEVPVSLIKQLLASGAIE